MRGIIKRYEPDRKGKKYDKADEKWLSNLVRERFDLRTIAALMHRTPSGISGAISKRDLSIRAARADIGEAEAVAKRLHLGNGHPPLKVSAG